VVIEILMEHRRGQSWGTQKRTLIIIVGLHLFEDNSWRSRFVC